MQLPQISAWDIGPLNWIQTLRNMYNYFPLSKVLMHAFTHGGSRATRYFPREDVHPHARSNLGVHAYIILGTRESN